MSQHDTPSELQMTSVDHLVAPYIAGEVFAFDLGGTIHCVLTLRDGTTVSAHSVIRIGTEEERQALASYFAKENLLSLLMANGTIQPEALGFTAAEASIARGEVTTAPENGQRTAPSAGEASR